MSYKLYYIQTSTLYLKNLESYKKKGIKLVGQDP